MILRNHYGVDMGTSGLIIQAQSRAEILADKMVAFALRPNRLKNRDVWDIGWLKQQNIALPTELVRQKVADHKHSVADFTQSLSGRVQSLTDDAQVYKKFVHEMRRFLPPQIVTETVKKEAFWSYITGVIREEAALVVRSCDENGKGNEFRM